MCAGFGWAGVHFLHIRQDEAVFWICAGNHADDAGMF